MKNQKLALLGTRGIPAAYGGFETFAEELSSRLVNDGVDVTVYCRYYFFEKKPELEEHKGVKLVYLPTFKSKFLDTPFHSMISFFHTLKCSYDKILLCNAANSPFAWVGRLKAPVYINVDGIERKRAKWNFIGKAWYILGELSSVLFATKVISDAKIISDYYKKTYKLKTEIITYGATVDVPSTNETLEKFSLEKNNYILYVSRLEPENNALLVIEAYNKLNTATPLVIVGDAPYSAEYIAKLYAVANDNVIFTGFQFGVAYRELRAHCKFYIQATEVGGTHPALVEAMAYGNAIIANDVPEHREVLEDSGVYYDFNSSESLAKKMDNLLQDPEIIKDLSKKAQERASQEFTWEGIVEKYSWLLGLN